MTGMVFIITSCCVTTAPDQQQYLSHPHLWLHTLLRHCSSLTSIFVEVITMPNINFDIFYDTDTVNFTASRGTAAPKVKPAWKVRSAPKLPPKTPPQPRAAAAFGPKQTPSEAGSDKPEKKKAPKLEVRSQKQQSQ